MNTPRILLLVVIASHMSLANSPAQQPMEPQRTREQYLSGTSKDDAVPWQFFCTANRKAGQWTTIPVPACWEFHGFGNFNYRNDDAKKPFEQGQYKHSFKVPSDWGDGGRRTFLVFDGVMTDADVKLNGQSAGPIHQGAFYPFKYDVTDKLKFGDQQNLLEVLVSKHSADDGVNRAERQADYWIFGGIFRPVRLVNVPGQFIERVAIDARADGMFNIDVYPNGTTTADVLEVRIFDAAGSQCLAEARSKQQPLKSGQPVRVTTKVASPKLWSAETPHLYRAQVTLLQQNKDARRDDVVLHQYTQRFGFRTIEVKEGDGIYVNGQRIIMKGVCRHSFWPDSGRTTSRKLSEIDVELMKDMNMNAVRMSHYPPDEHFLEVCDEKGLYVLDELAGWQKAYGTEVGKKLVAEMVPRDVNHPSIILWDNGNEGGWNNDLNDEFAKYDPQQREVIHPWEKFRKINTKHYPTFDAYAKLLAGPDIVMPTEFLHGLYDGGHGAGLADYWNAMLKSKVGAGGFLWVFSDEGAKRDDMGGAIDVAGNQAPDGILGPYREKEGSFYTIKELWSPVQARLKGPPTDSGLTVALENRYSFTNLRSCFFQWRLATGFEPKAGVLWMKQQQPRVQGPDVPPGKTGELQLPFNPQGVAAVSLIVMDPTGRQIAESVWPLKSRSELVRPLIGNEARVKVKELDNAYELAGAGTVARIDRKTGQLLTFGRNGKPMPLTGGPKLAWGSGEAVKVEVAAGEQIAVTGSGDLKSARWAMSSDGVLKLDFEYSNEKPAAVLGITFDFPEAQMKSHRWLGKGPYRVWANRMEGGNLGVHETAFNDTQTGYKDWIYPEFKGYFADWHWSRLKTDSGTLVMGTETPGLFLRLGTPAEPEKKLLAKCTTVFPPGNLSFLHGIAPIGNKFHKATDTGPQAQPHPAGGPYKGRVFFSIAD